MRRIILHPGYVVSRKDGDTHFINQYQLAALYSLDITKCLVMPNTPRGQMDFETREGDVHLYVRYDNNYERSIIGDVHK